MRITFLTGRNSIRVRDSKRSAKSEGETLAGDLELDWDEEASSEAWNLTSQDLDT